MFPYLRWDCIESFALVMSNVIAIFFLILHQILCICHFLLYVCVFLFWRGLGLIHVINCWVHASLTFRYVLSLKMRCSKWSGLVKEKVCIIYVFLDSLWKQYMLIVFCLNLVIARLCLKYGQNQATSIISLELVEVLEVLLFGSG